MTPPVDNPSPPAAPRARWHATARTAWSATSRAAVDLTLLAAAAVRRHTTPTRALVATGAAVTLTLASMAAVSAPASPAAQDSRWMVSAELDPPPSAGLETPPADPAPPHQPQRSFAVPPEPSPLPGPAGREGSSSSGGSTTPLPPETTDDFTAWAIMDLHTGQIRGSDNFHETSTTASMIKAWLVADYLRLNGGVPEDPDKLQELSDILRHSNNEYTRTLFEELGHHESIHRLISVCGLTDSSAVPMYWSNTRVSPRDTARMGACLADGRAAGGPDATDWLINEMRNVHPWGGFGIRHAFPESEWPSIAVKNGWVIRSADNEYHVNCMAIGDGWSMGVLTRYPAELGREHGAEICRSLAAEHLR